MVSLNEKYNLNHIYEIDVSNAELAIGVSAANQLLLRGSAELELFEKSLALASDLKRLPILRGVNGKILLSPLVATAMNATGNVHARILVELWEGDIGNIGEEDKLICSWVGYLVQAANVITVLDIQPMTWPFTGGYLLPNKVTATVQVGLNGAIAGAAFPIDRIFGDVQLEVDWVPVSKEQLQEYIVEHLYAEM